MKPCLSGTERQLGSLCIASPGLTWTAAPLCGSVALLVSHALSPHLSLRHPTTALLILFILILSSNAGMPPTRKLPLNLVR